MVKKNYKCFIGYLYNDCKVKLLHIIPPKTRAYLKHYDGQTKQINILIEHEDLLEKYNTICGKISVDIKKERDNEPVYNKKF